MSTISRRSSKEEKKLSFWFSSLGFTFIQQFISSQQNLMEGTSFTFALFDKSYLDLVRSSLILRPLFNLYLALQNIVLWRNVVKRIIILLQQVYVYVLCVYVYIYNKSSISSNYLYFYLLFELHFCICFYLFFNYSPKFHYFYFLLYIFYKLVDYYIL